MTVLPIIERELRAQARLTFTETPARLLGADGEATAACTIFAGHTVPEGGWCKVWAQKPGT